MRMKYLAVVLAIGVAGCDGEDPVSATVPVVKTIEAVSGSGQIAVYRSTLPMPLVVKVKDQFGASFPGAVVTFAVTGTVILDRYTVTTNSSGNAQVVFGYGTHAGVDTVTATVSGVSTPALFIETGNPGIPQLFTIVSGNNQSVTAGTQLANDLVVRVTDIDSNPLSNVPIVWTATKGTPTLTSNKSGADGTAHLQFTPGAGANAISSFVDLTPMVATFTATGN
jgi:hypothetical protein